MDLSTTKLSNVALVMLFIYKMLYIIDANYLSSFLFTDLMVLE